MTVPLTVIGTLVLHQRRMDRWTVVRDGKIRISFASDMSRERAIAALMRSGFAVDGDGTVIGKEPGPV